MTEFNLNPMVDLNAWGWMFEGLIDAVSKQINVVTCVYLSQGTYARMCLQTPQLLDHGFEAFIPGAEYEIDNTIPCGFVKLELAS